MKIESTYVDGLLSESKKDLDIDEFIMHLEDEDVELGEDERGVLEDYGNQIIKYTLERLETRYSFIKNAVKQEK